MLPKENHQIISEFLGYGASEPDYIFLEYEQSGDWSPEALIGESLSGNTIAKLRYEERISNILRTWKKPVLSRSSGEEEYKNIWFPPDTITTEMEIFFSQQIDNMHDTTELNEYKKNIFYRSSAVWYLLPLPCLSEDEWCPEYSTLFGVSESKTQYQRQILHQRFRILQLTLNNFRNHDIEPYIFLIGKQFWENRDQWRLMSQMLFPMEDFSDVFFNKYAEKLSMENRITNSVFFLDSPKDRSFLQNEEYQEIIEFITSDFGRFTEKHY